MNILNEIIDKLQELFPVNRIVALLTPLVFVPIAAWVAGLVADHFPGLPPLTSAQVLAVMVSAAVSAIGLAYKWLDGWQKHEAAKRSKVSQ